MNELSPPTLSEMIAAQYAALATARTTFGALSRTVAAQEATLRKLLEEARASSASPIDRARELGELSRGLDGMLKPFHAEALRPQTEFNRALVDVLKSVLGAPPSDRTWVRRRLEGLADPTAWRVKSHRSELSGQVVELVKKTYLKTLGPVLERVLARQRDWNLQVIAVLADSAALAALEQIDVGGDDLLRGQAAFNRHVVQLLAGAPVALPYAEWIAERERSRPLLPSTGITFSIVTPQQRPETLASLQAQTFEGWELEGSGEWVTVLEPGARLAPHALAEVAARVTAEVSVIYCDEDRLDSNGIRCDPFFKPDLSIELLSSCDFLARGVFVRASLYRECPDIRELVWRAVEAGAGFAHVPEVLYTSPAGAKGRGADFVSPEGLAIVQKHLGPARREGNGYRVTRARTATPLVSIIVPFKDKPELLRTLLRSLETSTAYERYELILVSNNSVEAETAALLASLTSPRIKKLTWDHPFHYPKLNNFGARAATGELLLFLNNDIEAIEPGWLDELVTQALRPEVGAVGAKLLFPDRMIQHAGVVVGMGGFAGHVFAGLPDDGQWTPFGHANWARDCLALTSACLMMRREVFDQLEGFDERFIVCGSDVDLCLRTRALGKRVVYTPHAVLLHHESATRSGASIPSTDFWESFRAYQPYLNGDPFFSPRLSLESTAPRLRTPSEPQAIEVALRTLGASEGLSSGRVAQVRRAQGMAQALDFGSAAIAKQPALTQPPRTLTWFVPYFDHPFGGIHTVLRFADAWRRAHGVENRFVIYDNPNVTARELEAKVAVIFPDSPGTFEILKTPEAVAQLPACDVGIATMWTGAYPLLRHPHARQRAYFVQDYEPLFYPAGTLSALAANTYDFGFFGIFNTRGLQESVAASHAMTGVSFEPSVDHEIFHAKGRRAATKPVRVFFYGRPSIDRNAFELGVETLRHVKARLKSEVEIVSAGEAWDPKAFDVDGVIENLGVLPFNDTAGLYRTIDVGLVFMFTRHPSYLPLELMACGVTVVTNQNPANAWLFRHGENALLAKPTASCVAEQVIAAAEDPKLRERISRDASQRTAATQWTTQTEQIWQALTRHCLGAP